MPIAKIKLPEVLRVDDLPGIPCGSGRAYFMDVWGSAVQVTRRELRRIIDADDEGVDHLRWYMGRVAWLLFREHPRSESLIEALETYSAVKVRLADELERIVLAALGDIEDDLAAAVWALTRHITREDLARIVERHIDLPD